MTKINQEEMLREMLNTACDNIGFEDVGINREMNNLYSKLVDILEEKCDAEQRELLYAIDDAVSFMLARYYDDGVVAGMEFVAAANNLMSNPSEAYKNILSSKSVNESPYSMIMETADKYRK